jgi:hypothetical protein
MATVTHEQANLLLKLYDLRREARLREARKWFNSEFSADSAEDMMQKYPMGSEGNVYYRMVLSYWDMACGMVNRGLIDDEMFFETSAEFWFMWEKVRPIAAGMRKMYGNPNMYKHIEAASARLEQWWERMSPGLVEGTRMRMAAARQTANSAAR